MIIIRYFERKNHVSLYTKNFEFQNVSPWTEWNQIISSCSYPIPILSSVRKDSLRISAGRDREKASDARIRDLTDSLTFPPTAWMIYSDSAIVWFERNGGGRGEGRKDRPSRATAHLVALSLPSSRCTRCTRCGAHTVGAVGRLAGRAPAGFLTRRDE